MTPLPSESIIGEVSIISGVPAPAIIGKRRKHRIVQARYLSIAAIRQEYPHWTLQHTGQLFAMDHTSIIHAQTRHREWLITDATYLALAREICRALFFGPRI